MTGKRITAIVVMTAILTCSVSTEAWGKRTSTWESHPVGQQR